MTKVLVLYYSSYGHIARMAEAVVEGARDAGAEVDIRRVPETAPAEVAATAKPPIASAESKITTALEDGVKPPPAALEKALVSPTPAKAPSDKVVAKAGTGKPADATPNNKPVSTATAADKDVNLIAALLSHGTGATPKTKSASAATAATASSTGSAPAATTEPASASLDATTLALKQCCELGFLEREVCRIKTCNNQWETNAACKATMSTANAKQ